MKVGNRWLPQVIDNQACKMLFKMDRIVYSS
jgi:hypothetical protein